MSTALRSSASSTTMVKVARRHDGDQATTLPAITGQRPGDGGPSLATMLYQPSGLTVMQFVRAYWDHVTIYYRSLDGRQTNEVDAIRQALKPLVRLFEHLPADLLGPKRLKLVRDELIALGLCRRTVNAQTGRIKRMYKWGVENELVAPSTYHGLQAVGGLKMGRTLAPEGEPVKPVQPELIEGVLQHVSRQVGAMIRLQLLTGMRPGELVIMRTCDIDRDTDVCVSPFTPQNPAPLP
jgi:integrase